MNVLTKVIITFSSAPVRSRILHHSKPTTCMHEIIDCASASSSFESTCMVAKMGTPMRRNVWLFDELTEEFSKDIPNPLVTSNESLAAPSNPVVELEVEPESVETTPDAPMTVSIQEKELFLQSVFDHVRSSFLELALTMAVDGSSGSPVLTMQKNLFNHPPFCVFNLLFNTNVTLQVF